MVLMKQYSFDMFEGLTKEMLLNAPTAPLEKLQKEVDACNLALEKYHQSILQDRKSAK